MAPKKRNLLENPPSAYSDSDEDDSSSDEDVMLEPEPPEYSDSAFQMQPAPVTESEKLKASPSNTKKKGKKDDNKQLFQRVFSEEDEIALLKGIRVFTTKNGRDPLSDIDGFCEYINESLHFDPTSDQLSNKIKRMEKKFINNLSRKRKNGGDPTFSNPHEQKLYDLSKIIWAAAVDRWKALHIAKLRLNVEKSKLALEQAQLALEAATS